MSLASNISLLGQSTAQSNRLAELRKNMDDLSRQATTGQLTDTYSGLGTKASTLQVLNSQQPLLQTYQDNIDNVSNKMTMMNNALTSISDTGNKLISAIQTQLQNSPTDVASVRQIAQQGLQTLESMMNQQINGQYLFAGSNSDTPPFIDDGALNSNFNNQITSWLSSGNTSALLSNVAGLSGASLGLSPGLSSSNNVTTQIGPNLNVDYTIKGNEPGFQDIIRALTLVANMPYPSSTDVATGGDFQTAMNSALTTAQSGVQEINDTAQKLAGKFSLVQAAQTDNSNDLTLVQNQISKLSTVDTSSAIVQMQALQTQLTASYQVTNIVSQLSLVNFINFN